MTHPSTPIERPRLGLGVILLTVFLDLVGFSIIFPLFPAMLEYYLAKEGEQGLLGHLLAILRSAAGTSSDDAAFYTVVLFGGVLGALYSLLQFVAAPLWGSLSDRIGRRPVLLLTVCGTALSYLLWGFAGSFVLLILSRLLGGVMAGNLSVATAAIADVTDTKSRAKGMGMLGAAFGMGFIFGPALGGLCSTLDLSSLGGGFGLNPFSAAALAAFLLAVLNVVWISLRFTESLPKSARRDAQTYRTANVLRLFSPTSMPGVSLTNLVYFAFILSFSGMEFTLTFLAHDRFHYTSLENTWLFLYTGVVLALVQGGVVRRLAPRVGEKRLALIGLVLVEPGLLLIGQAQQTGWLYGGLTFLSIGGAFVTPALSALVSLYAPQARQGEALGIFRSLGSLARAVGPLLAAALYWKLGSAAPYLGGAVMLVIPFVLALRLPKLPAPDVG